MNELEINDIKQVDHYYYDEYHTLRREECVVLKVTDFDKLCQLVENGYDRLDKIRTEIEEHAKFNQSLNIEKAKALYWCLAVIDKYTKGEE